MGGLPEGAELVTTLDVSLGAVYDVGELPGGFRRVISISGGTMAGPVLTGEVLPGGADWNTERPDGSAELAARYTVRTHDGVCIGVVNNGEIPVGFTDGDVVSAPVLEVPAGPYAWLAEETLIGTLDTLPGQDAVRVGIYRVAVPIV